MKRFKAAFFGSLGLLLIVSAIAAGHLHPDPDAPPPMEPESAASSVTLFTENGRWGAKTGGGRVLLEPNWYHLQVMSGNLLSARKNEGDSSCGIITADGEQLTPLLYRNMEKILPDVWKAVLIGTENKVHLYHADGTRWADRAWDACDMRDGQLILKDGTAEAAAVPEQNRFRLTSWHSEHPVGLHTLTADFTADELTAFTDMDTLSALGKKAAEYLVYLFVTPDEPPAAQFSGDLTKLAVARLYKECTYETGEIDMITEDQTDGFPAYRLHILVHYAGIGDDSQRRRYTTAMDLTVSRNASGAYTYSDFEDIRFRIMNGNRST